MQACCMHAQGCLPITMQLEMGTNPTLAPLDMRQGLKNLINEAYDYAVSDVPISQATFNTLNRCKL